MLKSSGLNNTSCSFFFTSRVVTAVKEEDAYRFSMTVSFTCVTSSSVIMGSGAVMIPTDNESKCNTPINSTTQTSCSSCSNLSSWRELRQVPPMHQHLFVLARSPSRLIRASGSISNVPLKPLWGFSAQADRQDPSSTNYLIGRCRVPVRKGTWLYESRL